MPEEPEQTVQPDPYAHLRAIIANSKDPHAVKAAQDLLDRLTANSNPA